MKSQRRAALVIAIAVAGAAALAFGIRAFAASGCANAIVCENQLAGTAPSVWDIDGAGDSTIQGYATDISYNQGDTASFKVNAPVGVSYKIDIYRLGWYQGNGARLVAEIAPLAGAAQPACLTDSTTGLVDCGNWSVSATWPIPTDAVSGVYIARLVRLDTLGASHMVFIIRGDSTRSDLLVQTSDETWQAYNRYGGNSLYTGTHTALGSPTTRAYKVSYNRPFTTRAYEPASWLFGPEFSMIRFLERNGYDTTYTTEVDSERHGPLIQQHKVFLSVGHDEYWSEGQRTNVTKARDRGVSLALFSGNEMFWKTRWESSIDGSNTAYRTLVCYKESTAVQKLDPTSTFTGNWRDVALQQTAAPGDPVTPENALTGQLYETSFRNDPIVVPASDAKLRFWRNTAVASLTGGQTASLPAGVLGYEWDVDSGNAFRPPGEFDMSSTTLSVNSVFDKGSQPGTITHSLSLYRAGSGALVFGAGTIQWAYGLDGTHDNTTGTTVATAPTMQQATVNVLADMGAQPGSEMTGLAAVSPSADTTAPTSTVTSPAPGTVITAGVPVTVTGTAADTGGGVVAGVEVSVDGGHMWHEATGHESWTYTFTPTVTGSATIKSRAVDDSGNLEVPGMRTCPCTIWSSSTIPASSSAGDAVPIELGVKFRSDEAGYVTGMRFYKGSTNTGSHVGHLWTSDGTLLGTVTFSNESASGWQDATLATPIAVQANTTYIASYYAPSGGWSLDRPYFTEAVDNAPLHGLADGTDGSNGVYFQGGSGFPQQTFQSSNYWVDVDFATSAVDRTPPTVTSVTPAPATTGVSTSTRLVARFSEPLTPSSVTASTFVLKDSAGNVVPTTVAYDSTSSVATLSPIAALSAGATYIATVVGGAGGVSDMAGNVLAASYTWSFTTGAVSATCPCSIWSLTTTPASTSSSDANGYELGVRLRSDVAGFVSGVRFYKGAGNTGTHVAHLWSGTGTLLATATFTGESPTGWQQVSFASPVAIQAGATYVASYTDPKGGYALDRPYFASSGRDNPPLHALADGFDGPNGVYSAPGTFPTSSYASSNYWVDVAFTTSATDTTPPTVTGVTPTAGATGVAVGSTVTVGFSEQLAAATVTTSTLLLQDGSGSVVSATVSYDASSSTATLTPTTQLARSTTYTATAKGSAGGVTDLAGNPLGADYSWSFTTGAAPTPAVTSTMPGPGATGVAAVAVVTATFSQAVDPTTLTSSSFMLAPAVAATISYDAATNTAKLTPASQLAPATTYTATLTTAVRSAAGVPLAAPVSWSFTTAAAPTLVSETPADGSTGVATGVAPTVTFSVPIDATTLTSSSVALSHAGTAVRATIAYNAATRTATITPAVPLAPSTSYSVTVSTAVASTSGFTLASPTTFGFTTQAGPSCPCTIWSSSSTPTTASAGDTNPIEVGVKFRSDVAGYISGIRFYKGSANTGTHVAHLWTPTGVLLATATFANETATGWQEADFDGPVAIAANATYVASYFAPNGGFAVDRPYFTSAVDNPPLHALADGFDGPNAVYFQGGSAFPTASYQSSNYWVDAVFTTTSTTPPTVSSVTPKDGATGVGVTPSVVAQFSQPMSPTSITTSSFLLRDPTGAVVPASVTYDATSSSATLVPNAQLAPQTSYMAIVKSGLGGATSTGGIGLTADYSWSFTTVGASACPCSLWSATTKPTTASASDSGSYEIGMRFRSDQAGYVIGVRFYKGSGNTGTHVGRLWTNSGTTLGQVTFTGETTTGWQQMNFASAIPIAANTTYVVSYADPKGHYSLDRPYFTSSFDAPPLHGLADGFDGPDGVYASATGSFPTQSYQSTNYWVDVVFSPTP